MSRVPPQSDGRIAIVTMRVSRFLLIDWSSDAAGTRSCR
jgi:hypothetical protein